MSPFSVWADRRDTRSYLAELIEEIVKVEEKSWESAILEEKKIKKGGFFVFFLELFNYYYF